MASSVFKNLTKASLDLKGAAILLPEGKRGQPMMVT